MLRRNNPARRFAGLMYRFAHFLRNRVWIAILRGRGARLENSAYFVRGCMVTSPKNIRIGPHCYIDRCHLYALAPIEVGRNTIVGRDAFICTGSHDVNSEEFTLVTKPIRIGDFVWIATGAIILPGVTIGNGAVVGAGAVVSHDVPSGSVVVGNPARVVKTDRALPAGFDPLRFAENGVADAWTEFRASLRAGSASQ